MFYNNTNITVIKPSGKFINEISLDLQTQTVHSRQLHDQGQSIRLKLFEILLH